MTTFKLTINCDNAAFDGDALMDELGLLLRATAKKAELGYETGNIIDTNGNTVGSFDLERDD